ncbi:MAG: hypothetical protein FD174_3458 [Geobacteraceae bacterium]|nr:MAG: hypothetical protein FD174_3458 [Geobacteraceae bacterium]
MRVLRRLTWVVLSAFALFYLTSCGDGGGGGTVATTLVSQSFTTTITLAQEVPPPITPVGVIPGGNGRVTLDPATNVLTGSFTTTSVANATFAHIHDGNFGVAGPVVVPLTQSPVGSGIWVVPAGTILTTPQVARLRAGGYYVNIHTTLNPTGEIRGQLIPAV